MFRRILTGSRSRGTSAPPPAASSRQPTTLPEDTALFFLHTSAALLVADPQTGRILIANHSAAVLTGYSVTELTERTLADLVIAEEWGRLKAQLARLHETHRAAVACTLVSPGQPRRTMDALASWVDLPGTSLAMVELREWDDADAPESAEDTVPDIARDAPSDEIAEVRRELVDARQTIATLHRRRLFGHLAAGTLHDLHDQLTVVGGRASLLESECSAENDALRGGLEEIRRAAERGATLARQLGALAHTDGPAAPRTMDLLIVLSSLEGLLRRSLDERVTLRIDRPAHAARIVADKSEVEHAVLTSIVDAASGLVSGGEVALSMTACDIETETDGLAPGRYLCVCIARTESGAAAAEEVVRRYWPMPATVVAREHEPVAVSSARPIGHETILIAEDDPAVRALIKETLAAQGFRILEAVTSDEAHAWYKRHASAVDAVVADVGLPGMSAGQLRRALRAIRPDVRILWLSGHTDRAVVKRGLRFDEDAVLAKPFEPASLLARLREMLAEAPGATEASDQVA